LGLLIAGGESSPVLDLNPITKDSFILSAHLLPQKMRCGVKLMSGPARSPSSCCDLPDSLNPSGNWRDSVGSSGNCLCLWRVVKHHK